MRITLTKPGLFITATDTEVGKTVITCAIAATLRQAGLTVGVCKPIASGCRREREQLVSPDAEALAHFADCRLPLATINPIRYRAALAPAVAIDRGEPAIDDDALAEALRRLDEAGDVMLVEGLGGILAPIDEQRTVLDLAAAVGYPVLVVCRPDLGTLNHTALTCAAIRQRGLRLAGLVINQFVADSPDLAIATNPRWLAHQNKTKVLATVPRVKGVIPERGEIPAPVLEAIAVTDWPRLLKPANRRAT